MGLRSIPVLGQLPFLLKCKSLLLLLTEQALFAMTAVSLLLMVCVTMAPTSLIHCYRGLLSSHHPPSRLCMIKTQVALVTTPTVEYTPVAYGRTALTAVASIPAPTGTYLLLAPTDVYMRAMGCATIPEALTTALKVPLCPFYIK